MQLIRCDTSAATDSLLTSLLHELKLGKRVLWLVPGGSNIPLSCSVMSRIPTTLSVKLTVMLTDERYGNVGHADSNEQQLRLAGFNVKDARFLSVLNNLPLADTIAAYSVMAQIEFSNHEVLFGQFGIGTDGHIAGILPSSPAATETEAFAISYVTAEYTRLTLTFPALRKLHRAYAFVYGSNKRQALTELRDTQIPLEKQPAQILKVIPQAYVYNDQLE